MVTTAHRAGLAVPLVLLLLVGAFPNGGGRSDSLASPPGGDRSDVRGPLYYDADGQDVSVRRVRVRTADGVLLVYDAGVPPITEAAGTPSRDRGGYLAFWNDYLTEQLYVYERVLFTRADVGHVLLNLELDLGIDLEVFVTADTGLNQSLIQALAESADPTEWRVATRGAIRSVMELPGGASGELGEGGPEPVCPSPEPQGGIGGEDVGLPPGAASLPVITLPPAPLFDFSGEAVSAAGCLGDPGDGGVNPPDGCVCCIDLVGPDANCCVDSCNDGFRCTLDDNCDTGNCIGTPMDCDDNEPCTHDWCDEESGSCVHRFCNDGDPCTDDECVDHVCEFPWKCDDDNECTRDTCTFGVCDHELLTGTWCDDDENNCTDDVCSSGTCTHIAYEFLRWCEDEDPPNECTYDVCSGTKCTHPPKDDGTSCEPDPNACTDDVCQGGTCSHIAYEVDPPCEDEDPPNECTDDVCSGTTCTHPAKDDGTSCTLIPTSARTTCASAATAST